jgi:hypothetical protein
MKFECGDLERALANPDLMAEAREHLRDCAVCRNEYRIWNEISSAAKELHCEWESPDLWLKIRGTLEAQRTHAAKQARKSAQTERRQPKQWWMEWKLWALSAGVVMALVLTIVLLPRTVTVHSPNDESELTNASGQDFLTERALKEVEKNETAYRRSIEELSRLAQPKLESRTSSPILVSYREKLLMLDSASLETRSNISQNRFNVRLQTELADLYRDKRHTLQEVLTNDQR